jgi:plasmid maintenance system antidote protein VapI
MLKQGMPPKYAGEILKKTYVEPLEVNITPIAENRGITPKTISQLVHDHLGIDYQSLPILANNLLEYISTC